MADASYAQTSFLGGLWSKYAQGRFDRPDYRTALNECLNAIPIEQGPCVRRPGTEFAATTRNGAPGRLIPFDIQQSAPYLIELTNGFLRFYAGSTLVSTNDDKSVVSISAANPAVVATSIAHGWSSGQSVQFAGPTASIPDLLENRVFLITVTSPTQFSLADPTGGNIDGSTLSALGAGVTVQRILEIASPYTGTLWKDVRLVQTELRGVLLHNQIAPRVLTATPPLIGQTFYSFALTVANLIDGPYIDPPTNGAIITPSATSGIVTLTLSFQAWSVTKAYQVGDFVTQTGVSYQSLVDQNIGSTPPSANWVVVNSGVAIGPNGFTGGDVGRFMRIFDSAGNWTWGKITAIANLISGALAGSTNVGTMTGNGGLAAAFDSVTNQAAAASALGTGGGDPTKVYVGKNYTGATTQRIASASLWPSNDLGLFTTSKVVNDSRIIWQVFNDFTFHIIAGPTNFPTTVGAGGSATINLRGKVGAGAPANSADGVLLGSAMYTGGTAPVTIISTDATTLYNFVWFEVVVSGLDLSVPATTSLPTTISFVGQQATTDAYSLGTVTVNVYAAEAQFFAATSGAGGNAISLQILGAPFADTTSRSVWRLGVYAGSVGFPTCGTYHEGRLWLAGSVGNRLDGSKSNDIFNFQPSNTVGTVADSNAISVVFNAPDVNVIFWLTPDQLGIICGTLAGDWLVQASANNNPLTPTSIQVHRVNRIGCANIEPRRADHTLILVQRYRRKLFEYFADVFSGKFAAQNVTWAARNLTKQAIAEIAYQYELTPMIWARCDDGSFFGITYKRESNVSSQPPTFAGPHRHLLGSGRLVESLVVGPSNDGTLDSLCMVTNDPMTNIRHVEIMTPIFEEGTSETAAWFLDDAVVPSSTVAGNTTFTLNGLWYLNGKTATVFCGGIDCGDWPVIQGSITMTYGDGISAGTGNGLFTPAFALNNPFVVGFTYTTRGQIVRPATPTESGARTGPALGKKRRTMQYAILVDMAAGISFGTNFNQMFPALFRDENNALYTTGRMFSGVYWSTLQDNYSYDSMICWQVTRPYSATICAIEGFIQTQDK